MEAELSHIAQWMELNARAKNFGLDITFDAHAFYLWLKNSPSIFDPLGQYLASRTTLRANAPQEG